MTDNRPRILIVQDNNFDYGPAEEHGDVEFLTSEDWSTFANSPRNEKITADVRCAFLGYVPNHDFVVLTGSPFNQAVVVSEMLKYGKSHMFLKWDNRKFVYTPVQMVFPA